MYGVGSGYIKQQEEIASPTLIHDEIRSFMKQNRVSVVTDKELGSHSSSLIWQMSKRQLFKEYGKLHAVYARKDAGDDFEITSLIYKEALAERHADLLIMQNDYNTAIVTSAYSTSEINKSYTRSGLDERGHHYVAQ